MIANEDMFASVAYHLHRMGARVTLRVERLLTYTTSDRGCCSRVRTASKPIARAHAPGDCHREWLWTGEFLLEAGRAQEALPYYNSLQLTACKKYLLALAYDKLGDAAQARANTPCFSKPGTKQTRICRPWPPAGPR